MYLMKLFWTNNILLQNSNKNEYGVNILPVIETLKKDIRKQVWYCLFDK